MKLTFVSNKEFENACHEAFKNTSFVLELNKNILKSMQYSDRSWWLVEPVLILDGTKYQFNLSFKDNLWLLELNISLLESDTFLIYEDLEELLKKFADFLRN